MILCVGSRGVAPAITYTHLPTVYYVRAKHKCCGVSTVSKHTTNHVYNAHTYIYGCESQCLPKAFSCTWLLLLLKLQWTCRESCVHYTCKKRECAVTSIDVHMLCISDLFVKYKARLKVKVQLYMCIPNISCCVFMETVFNSGKTDMAWKGTK